MVVACPRCRSPLEPSARVCPSCRAALEAPARAEDAPPPTPATPPEHAADAQHGASLSAQYGVPVIDLRDLHIPADVLALVPRDLATQHRLVPVRQAGPTLVIAMADPSDIFTLDAVERLTQCAIEVTVASEGEIAQVWRRDGGG